jgi:probable rRNA maturation factor
MTGEDPDSDASSPEGHEEILTDSISLGIQVASEFKDKVNTERLGELIRQTLETEVQPRTPVELALVVGDDAQIHKLNRQFRGVDAPTDVLSFAMSEDEIDTAHSPDMPLYLGDVIISYPRAKDQAKAGGHATDDELDLLVVHGVLHLLGYDHDTNSQKSRMWARQETILGKRLID